MVPPGQFPGAKDTPTREFQPAPGGPSGPAIVGHELPKGFFVGPGGCTSPSECITYCAEHKETCFNFSAPGAPLVRPPQAGLPPGHEDERGRPQIRQDLLHKFERGELPEDFRKRPPEERERIFREKLPESGGGGTINILLEPNTSGFLDMEIRASGGIREFALTAREGKVYSGEVPGCSKEFKSRNIGLSPGDFPITAGVVDCAGKRFEKKFGGNKVNEPEPAAPVPVPTPPPSAGGTAGHCPLLPTVESCSAGQRKEAIFSSPDCGTYYRCVEVEDAARICASKGGVWDGSTCRLPTIPPPPPPDAFHTPPTGTFTPPPTEIFPPPPTGTFIFPPPPPTDTSILPPPPPPSTILLVPEMTCSSGFVLEKDKFGISYCAPISCGTGAVLKILDDGRKTCFIGAGFNYLEQFLLHPFAGIFNFFFR